MKKKYIILLLVSGVICILLPLTIDLLFNIGEKHPIIVTRFSASDILSYCSGVIGIFLSVVAIIMSLQTNDIDIKIKHAHTVNDNNQESIWLEIVNNSVFECQITSVEFANLKSRHFCKVFHAAPFYIKAKDSHSEIVELADIKKKLSYVVKSNKKSRIYYCIRTSLNQTIYLSTADLYKCIKESEVHQQMLDKLKGTKNK